MRNKTASQAAASLKAPDPPEGNAETPPDLCVERSPAFRWINPWRKEISEMLSCLSLDRRPALRRSFLPDYLFAVDLPSFAPLAAMQSFLCLAEEKGWRCLEKSGWLNLSRDFSGLPDDCFPPAPDGEAACLLVLLRRHPGTANSSAEILQLMKAREEGPEAFEKACRALHRDLAARLRKKESFPALILS